MTNEIHENDITSLTADVVAAYVSNNPVPISDLAGLIEQVHRSLRTLGSTAAVSSVEELQKPAVPIRKSVTPDFIISLEDGRQFKSLKRHLSSHYGMTPDEYRAKWGLPADYPMVAPNYAASRSALAKKLGLGRKPKEIKAPLAKSARRKA